MNFSRDGNSVGSFMRSVLFYQLFLKKGVDPFWGISTDLAAFISGNQKHAILIYRCARHLMHGRVFRLVPRLCSLPILS